MDSGSGFLWSNSSEFWGVFNIEDIEILRFVESDIPVTMVEVPSGTLAVDVPDDVLKVVEFIQRENT